MGTMIKAHQNRPGTNNVKVRKQNQLLRSILVHAVSVLICTVVCSYSYWFPWLYCLANHFLWIYLPSVCPVVFGPKCMFVVANAIVVVVAGEWRRTCAESDQLHRDMYEDYVRRSRRPRRVLVYKKVERKEEASVKEMHMKALEIKKEETVANSFAEDKKEETIEQIHMSTHVEEAKEDIIVTDVDNSEEKDEEAIEEASTNNTGEKKEEMNEEDGANNSDEKETATVCGHEDASEAQTQDEVNGEDGQNGEAEETRADDELNKRVEDFIARVNKRRWIEANKWLICSA
uniref:DUF4408 domain-containing protein n=1 Tax=Kalanchoe fedtschenkoi TaxID=63787 RepID=A0A7N0UX57_KALFE